MAISSNGEKATVSPEHRRFLQKLRFQRRMVLAIQAAILVGFFLLWEIAAANGWINSFITSRPSRAWATAYRMAMDGELFFHLAWTVGETVIGFTVGTLAGILVAILLWWFRFLARILDPYIVVLNSIPKVALGPIFIVWLGTNVTTVVAMAIAISVIVTIMMVYNGFREVDENKVKLLQSFGANRFQILTMVILPSSIPTMIAALKVTVGLSLVGTIVGEFLASRQGLGYLIIYGGQVFNMSLVMASIILLSIISVILYYAVHFLENKVARD